jgi:Ulp1 family protease
MKKYIFIPINQRLHWSLCVVVNPGAILNEVEEYGPNCEETMEDELMPCFYYSTL